MRTHIPHRIVRAALIALCCSLLPSLALAQTSSDTTQKPPAKKKSQKAKAAQPAAAAEKPAPVKERAADEERPSYAPPPRDEPPPQRPLRRAARAPSPSQELLGKLEVEGSLGLAIPFESGASTGFKLNVAGFYGFQELTPTILLQLGGNIGFAYHGFTGGSLVFFDLLPTARLRINLNEKLHAMADGGAGLGIARVSTSGGGFSFSRTDAAFLLKLGGGIGYDLNEKITLVGMPALNIYLKDGSSTVFTLLVGASMRL